MKYSLLATIFFCFFFGNAQTYKQLQEDEQVNFYEVVRQGEAYFQTIDVTKKGSGYKQFERWKNANEYKYYPSGDRTNIDPYFPENAYKTFLENSPQQNRMAGEAWSEVGPTTVETISGHYSAGLGRIEDFWVDPVNADLIYLVSRSGGFFKSTNGGGTWAGGATDFLIATGSNTITVSPTNANDIIINVRNARNGTTQGLYRSTDGGDTWVETNFNPTTVGAGGLGSNFQVYDVTFHPTNANVILIATSNGLYRSSNGLSTWTHTFVGFDSRQLVFHPTNSNIVYLFNFNSGVTDNVYRSTDGGINFTQSNNIPGQGNIFAVMSVSASCPDCVYFASSSGVWKSTNQGVDFVNIAANPSPYGLYGGFAVSDTNDDYMVFGSLDSFRTTNNGATFSQCAWWYLGDAVHGGADIQSAFDNTDVYIHADNRNTKSISGIFYAATDGFLCRSTDFGATWEVISQGVGTRENYKLGVSQSNAERAMLGSQDNGTSVYTENGWLEVYGADGMEAVIHPLNDDYMVGSVQFGTRRATKDGGLITYGIAPAGESGSGNADWEAPLAIDPNNQMRIYHYSQEVYASDDFGNTWNLQGDPSFSGTIDHAEIAYNNSQIMIVTDGANIEKSTDGGATFTNIKNSLPTRTIKDIAFDPNNDDRIMVVYADYQNNGQKIYMSENGGSSWTNITGNLGNMPIHAVVMDYEVDSRIYVGAEIGVYTKLLSESNWELYSNNLPNTTIEELEINRGANMLNAATWGRGMWSIPMKDRADHPKIALTEITNQPTEVSPSEGSLQFVTSTIEYAGNLQTVQVLWSENAATFGNSITMSNSGGNIWVSDEAIPTQTVGTKMYFKVRATSDDGKISETYKFMFTYTAYGVCAASGNAYPGIDEFISSTTIGSVVTNSGQDLYTYYNTPPIELAVGSDYPIEIQLGGYYAGDEPGAWLDMNRDGVYDESERIAMSAYSGSFLSQGILSVPYDAVRDQVMVLRLRNSYNSTSPCGTFDGEVEDYAIILREPCFDKPFTTLNGSTWSNGTPDLDKKAVVNTSITIASGSGFNACSCEVTNGNTLTIAAGAYLKTKSDIISEGNLLVEHQGIVVQEDPLASVTKMAGASIQVELTTPLLKKRDFMLMGSPMDTETRNDVFGNAFLVLSSTPENFWPYSGVPTGGTNFADDKTINGKFLDAYTGAINRGEGYLVRPQSGYNDPAYNGPPPVNELTFDMVYSLGTLNNGSVSRNIIFNGLGDNPSGTPNLLANPYASPISAADLINDNDLINELYFWEHLTPPSQSLPGSNSMNFDMDDISLYNGAMGIPAANDVLAQHVPNGVISTGQGFAIKAQAAGTMSFTNTMRLTDGNTTLRTPLNAEETNTIMIGVRNTDYEVGAFAGIAFNPQATEAWDLRLDSPRLATVVSLYSHLQNGSEQLGIQSLPAFESGMKVPVGFATQVPAILEYTITLTERHGNEIENATVYLIDNLEGTITNLTQGDYSFKSGKQAHDSRFTLQFEAENVLGVQELSRTISLYPNPTEGNVHIVSTLSEIDSVTIYDLAGRKIDDLTYDGKKSITMNLSSLASAVYFVTVTTQDGSVTKRIIKE